MSELTAENLKSELWKTMQELRAGQMQSDQGNAIAYQAREILRTVRTQLMVTSQAKRPVPKECVKFAGE